MPIFRKKNGKDTWHWCQDCFLSPSSDYKEVKRKPTSGKLCYQCAAKAKGGGLQKIVS